MDKTHILLMISAGRLVSDIVKETGVSAGKLAMSDDVVATIAARYTRRQLEDMLPENKSQRAANNQRAGRTAQYAYKMTKSGMVRYFMAVQNWIQVKAGTPEQGVRSLL